VLALFLYFGILTFFFLYDLKWASVLHLPVCDVLTYSASSARTLEREAFSCICFLCFLTSSFLCAADNDLQIENFCDQSMVVVVWLYLGFINAPSATTLYIQR